MVKRLLIMAIICLLPAAAVAVEVDADNNNAVDITYGGTNATTAAGARTALGAESETHASDHQDGGADEIAVETLPTSGATGTAPVSDGAGGLTMTDIATQSELDAAVMAAGSGDMLKSTYDTDNDGVVDEAAAVSDGTYGDVTVSGSTWTVSGTTDNQTLSFSAPNLSISGGNSVDISAIQDGTGTDDQTAAEVNTSTANFNGNLSASDTTVQAALETLDDMTSSGSAATRIVKLTEDGGDPLTAGDGKFIYIIESALNGTTLTGIEAACGTASSSGVQSFAIYNVTDSVDMLSTNVTIDAGEYTSATAATAAVIDAATDDVATGDRIRIDCDAAGTGVDGNIIYLTFE